MTDTTYNGWKNWATWNVALWLGNDPYLYGFSRRFVSYKDLANDLKNLALLALPMEQVTRMMTLTPTHSMSGLWTNSP